LGCLEVNHLRPLDSLRSEKGPKEKHLAKKHQ